MKSSIKKIISFILIISFALILCGCGSKVELSFEVNGGSPISAVSFNKKSEYTLPTPTREGFIFEGWYLNSDFSGESIESLTVDKNTTVYAKWAELYKITLNPDGGSLDKTTIYGKAGDSVLELVKDLVPTKEGLVFGAWFNGSTELSSSTKLTNKGMTLTAKYKVEYTINLYKEKLSHNGYDKEELKEYDYVGKTISYSLYEDGLVEVEKEDSKNEIVLKENKSENTINVYYDRELFTVTLRSNYPDQTKAEETKTIKLYYGEEIELPDVDFAIDGYYLLGFAQSNTSEIIYNAHYIDNLPVNKEDSEVVKDKISANRTMSLYAVWNKGYKDMFGGSDYVFVSPDKKTAYLSREGVYFIGDYFDNDKSFIFYNDKENLEGMIYSDGTYAYYNSSRDEYSATLYTVGVGLDDNIKVFFDPYNGITYYDGNEDPELRESKGTYTIDENNFYHVTFTEGLKAGETMIIIVGKVTADYVTTEAFQLRREEEYGLGTLVRFTVNNSEITHYLNAYQIELSGFGTLTYNNGQSVETYYYSYDSENKFLTINASNGSNFGKVKVMTIDGVNGYMFYDESVDKTYNGEDGSTLVLDGISKATYTTDETSITGYYTIKSSAFGGNIVTFKNNGTEYTFLTSSKTEEKIVEGDSGSSETESVTTYTFKVKPNGYSEYYYKNETSIYYAPLVVLNDTEEGKANVYGYTTNKTFELVLEGTYTYDSNTKLYVFTTTKVHDKKVLTNPQDIKKISSFVFQTDTTSTSYSISFWHSATIESETTNYKKEYTGANNSSLVLINGIAILSKDGYVITGIYSTRGSVTQISGQAGVAYVEIDDEAKTFIALEHAPYNAYVVMMDGSYSNKEYLAFDGKGNAKYVYYVTEASEEVEKFYEGTISDTGKKTKQGATIYSFTSPDKSFTYLQDERKTFVFPYYEAYSGTYTSDYGILYLDGYLNHASFTNTDGDEFTSTYFIESENVVTFEINNKLRYFDINAKSFSLRGAEYGTYTIVDNQGSISKYLEINGYGALKVFKYDTDGETKIYLDESGTYTISGGKFSVSYKESTTDYSLVGYLGTYKESGKITNAFLVEHTEFVQTLINNKDWSILRLESNGHAVRVDNKGNKDEGTYTIITDTLLYYENNAGSFANIYKYDSAKSTMVESRFVPRGYYTEDLKSLLFSQYGFAVFNFETRYYYNVTTDGVMIYHLDKEDASANKYGYVEENFGSFDATKEYKGDTYYQNDGFAITFTRKEETKDDYPVLVIRNPETRSPLGNLVFSPTGNDTFTSQGTVTCEPMSLNCTVVREYVNDHYEMYVLVGYYRFDITVHYSGKAEDGSSTSTYEVTGMRMNRKFDSYAYLNNYYMYYYFYGQSFVSTYENNLGVISQVQTFDKDGKLTEDYMKVEFGNESKALDLNGNLINTDNVSYEYDEQNNSYTLEYEASDGYTYKLYILIRTHQAFNANAYIIYAVTRSETIVSGNYELNIERIITSDYNFPVGGVFNAKLKLNDNEIKSTESFELDGVLHYVGREYDEGEKITSTAYYKLELVLKDSESLAEDTVVPYESVTITPISATTHYTEDNKSYVDIVDSKIVFVSIDGTKYLVSECKYDSETNTYSIILNSLAEYTVKINEDLTITLTEIVEEETTEESE